MNTEQEHTKLDFDQAYKVDGQPGIAWRVTSYEIETVVTQQPDPFDDEYLVEDYEQVTNYDRVVCHMIGDDRDFTFDVDDLTALDEDEYCSGCGQIGCGWC